jgi:thioredoxin reductase (NADPH)
MIPPPADSVLAYAAPLLVIWVLYVGLRALGTHRSRRLQRAAAAAGLTEPTSLHPAINPLHCIGCAACVAACPEENVLGVIGGKAELIHPTKCIGHGACAAACPTHAITLVFGTATRGVDIPVVGPDFQTSVPGVFIAGELGGMGLIRNAVEQSKQAVDAIAKLEGIGHREARDTVDRLDLVIVGAGPAGFSASLASMQRKLRFITLEQDTLGGTVAHYPRGKIVMTAPVKLPIVGKLRFTETTKESLLRFWQDVEAKTGLEIRYGERVEAVSAEPGGFVVTSNGATHHTRAVLLAIGRRGTPRKLGVPGEDQSKVVYRLIDPGQYAGKHVLVVGGGDSAIEAALSLAAEDSTDVTLSYRGSAFARAKEANRDRLEAAVAAGRSRILLESEVVEITDTTVLVKHGGAVVELPNDAVVVCAGGILPTPFLSSIGIEVETKHGTA